MSDELDLEDLAALGVLEDIAHGAGQEDTAPVEPPPADEAAEVLRRLYVEGLGLLAYELLPAQPQPGTRATVLAHLIGDETQEVSPLLIGAAHAAFAPASPPHFSPSAVSPTSPASPASPTPPAAPFTAKAPAQLHPPAEPATPGVAAHREAQAWQVTRRSRWPAVWLTLFALAAAGLGVWVAMLQSEIAYRDTQIRGLGTRLAEVDRLKGELDAVHSELAALEQRHAFVTAPSTTIFALRPPVGSLQPTARGSLFVAPDRRHWQLEVRGLKPEPEPQDYQLWFIVDGLPLSGGVFDGRLGTPSVLEAGSLPAGTTAVAITLERKGGTASPTSPILLTAASSVQI